MNKNINKLIDPIFIKRLFEEKKSFYFPAFKAREIIDIRITKVSPDWAKESYLLRYRILFDDKTQKIIRGVAKAYRSKRPTWQIMRYLYSHSFRGTNLRIRKPLGYIKGVNLLLYEEVPGLTLAQIIERKNKIEIKRVLKNTAKWLVKLHNLSLGQKKFPKAIFIGLNGYKNIFKKIREYIPELKDNLIPTKNLGFINQPWYDKKSLIHNDFYPGNAIVNKNTIYGIDFDRAGLGPFLMDIATLYGALEFPKEVWNLKISKKQIINFQKIFLLEYCKLRKLDYSGVKDDLKQFLVKIFLDQVYYYASFIIKGWGSTDKKTKDIFAFKIKSLLIKIEQQVKNI